MTIVYVTHYLKFHHSKRFTGKVVCLEGVRQGVKMTKWQSFLPPCEVEPEASRKPVCAPPLWLSLLSCELALLTAPLYTYSRQRYISPVLREKEQYHQLNVHLIHWIINSLLEKRVANLTRIYSCLLRWRFLILLTMRRWITADKLLA